MLSCFMPVFCHFNAVFRVFFVKRFHIPVHKFYTCSPTKSAFYVVLSLLRIGYFLSFQYLVLFNGFS